MHRFRSITRLLAQGLACCGALFSGKQALFAQTGADLRQVAFKVHVAVDMDSIFPVTIAGSFNQWNPAGFSLTRTQAGVYEGVIPLSPGSYQFKCTRGAWTSVEQSAQGTEVANRSIQIHNDTQIVVRVDQFKSPDLVTPRPSTASPQVQVVDTAFFIPQLNRTRAIRIYLPIGYASSRQRYPVMYMLDGQNLFDEATAAFGEWGVDECLDSMQSKRFPTGIVVGIDNGPKRIQEYNPYDNETYGIGEGNEMIKFITETLKPWIDKRFRTLTGKANTGIGGSSMGGLLAYVAMTSRGDVFGLGAVLSPSFWIAPRLDALTKEYAYKTTGRYFLYRGGDEDDRSEEAMDRIFDLFAQESLGLIYRVTDPDGTHSEATWRKWLPDLFTYLWSEGFDQSVPEH